MPIQGDNYVAPEWKNGQPPAINAQELNDMSQAIEDGVYAAQTSDSDDGTVSYLLKNGQNIWARTVAEAVKASATWGGNLDTALQKLIDTVLYHADSIPKYTESVVNMNNVTEGQIVTLPVNGVATQHYVASLNYEQDLNGVGKRLLVPITTKNSIQFNTTETNVYANSHLDTWVNTTYKERLPNNIQEAMGTTKFYYTPGGGNYTVTVYERPIFILSLAELGLSENMANVEGTALPIASTILSGERNSWTRSPMDVGDDEFYAINSYGAAESYRANIARFVYPCFTLPSTFSATYYFDGAGNVKEEQEYDEAGSFTDVSGNTLLIPHIQLGSYLGSGTYGQNHPITLTFGFTPYLLIVRGTSAGNTGVVYVNGMTNQRVDWSGSGGSASNIEMSISENSISWYSTNSATNAMNENGTTYRYVAIGAVEQSE